MPIVMPVFKFSSVSYLIQVDDWLPEVVALLVEISHSDLSKVTGMVLVHVCSVVVLSTCKTSTTGVLAVLSYTTVAGGDVTAAVEHHMLALILLAYIICCHCHRSPHRTTNPKAINNLRSRGR